MKPPVLKVGKEIEGEIGHIDSLTASFNSTQFNHFRVLLVFLFPFESVIYDNCQALLWWLLKGQILAQAIFQACRNIKLSARNGAGGMNSSKTSVSSENWFVIDFRGLNHLKLWCEMFGTLTCLIQMSKCLTNTEANESLLFSFYLP